MISAQKPRIFSEDSRAALHAMRLFFTYVPRIRERFYSPPGKENACGYYAFAAVMDFVTMDKRLTENFVIGKLREAGHEVTTRMGANY